MTLVKINEDNIFTVIVIGSWILLALLALAGAVFVSLKFAASVLAGGILAIANFYWLRSILVRAFRLLPEVLTGAWTHKYPGRCRHDHCARPTF